MRFYMPAAALAQLRKGKSTRVTLTAKQCGPDDVTVKVAELYDAAIADHIQATADTMRLVRELDVLLNSPEGAAKQASLCDIVAQVRKVVGPGPHLLARVGPL